MAFDPEHLDELVEDFKAKSAIYTEAAAANNTAQVAAQDAQANAAVAMDAMVNADTARDQSADALIEYLESVKDELREMNS